MKNMSIIGLLIAALLSNSCSTTYITSTWKAPDVVSKKYRNVLVLGIIREADRNLRIQMEDHLAGDLKELGYNAYSAYEAYGPKMFQDMPEEQANEKLKKDNVDAVLTIVLLDKERERYYNPGRIIYSPYAPYHDHFWRYYHSLNIRVQGPGYYQVATKYFWESNFYDLKENKLLYSVQTQSFDPETTNQLAHEYGQKIIQNMIKNKMVQKQEENVLKAM